MPRKTPETVSLMPREPGASMRPRPDAAENAVPGEAQPGRTRASMRPRPDAAENLPARHDPRPELLVRFNEAAARCRGKPRDLLEEACEVILLQ